MKVYFTNYKNIYNTPNTPQAFYGRDVRLAKSKIDGAVENCKFGKYIADEYNVSLSWVHEAFKKFNNGKSLKDARRENVARLVRSSQSDELIAQQLNVSLIRVKDMRCALNNSRQQTKQARVNAIRNGLLEGKTTADIANELGLKEHTVKVYIREFKLREK